jgi:hypothetical protein
LQVSALGIQTALSRAQLKNWGSKSNKMAPINSVPSDVKGLENRFALAHPTKPLDCLGAGLEGMDWKILALVGIEFMVVLALTFFDR